MKTNIVIVSDSHGCPDAVKQAADFAGTLDNPVFVHAGDFSENYVDDESLKPFQSAFRDFMQVANNNRGLATQKGQAMLATMVLEWIGNPGNSWKGEFGSDRYKSVRDVLLPAAEEFVKSMQDYAAKDYSENRDAIVASGVPALLIPGNHDYNKAWDDVFGDLSIHGKRKDVNGLSYGGFGGSNDVPPNWAPFQALGHRVYTLDPILLKIFLNTWSAHEIARAVNKNPFPVAQVSGFPGSLEDVLVVHEPPKFSCDRALRPGGYQHVGNQDIAAYVRQRDGGLVLCGHIHEAKGIDVVGSVNGNNVVVVNPGSLTRYVHDPVKGLHERDQSSFAVVEMDGKKALKVQFYNLHKDGSVKPSESYDL